jgi:hypothetical protein
MSPSKARPRLVSISGRGVGSPLTERDAKSRDSADDEAIEAEDEGGAGSP